MRCATPFDKPARAPFHIDAWVVLPDQPHCSVDLATRRCEFPRSVARDQDRVCKSVAHRRAAINGHDQPRRTRHLATAVLGAHDPRRSGFRGSHGLHAFQPSRARSDSALLAHTWPAASAPVPPVLRGHAESRREIFEGERPHPKTNYRWHHGDVYPLDPTNIQEIL
jgi:hypothetical protein